MRVLITGVGGFIGRHLADALASRGFDVRGSGRGERPAAFAGEYVRVQDLGTAPDWRAALSGVDAVVHLASLVHRRPPAPLACYRRINVEGTRALATQARECGVARLVYLSSVKAVGGRSDGVALSDRTPPHPTDAYGISKLEAERMLAEMTADGVPQSVIVRPPLVYGAHVGGNFLRLLGLAASRWPLPLAAVCNRRSLCSVYNLCDLLVRCLEHHDAGGARLFVSDGHDLSTAQLIERLAALQGRRARLFAVPTPLLRAGGRISGQYEAVSRLCDSLQVDIEPTRARLGWAPPLGVDDGLARTVAWYRGRS